MNKPLAQLLRGCLSALTLAACLASAAYASDAHRPDVSVAAPNAAVAAQQQLQRLSLEAAMVDSSAFGQLRLLRDVEARTVQNQRSRTGESCR